MNPHNTKTTGTTDVNVVGVVKGAERYVFIYDEDNCVEALRTLGRFASDPELSFSWYDAAVLGQKIRRGVPSQQQSKGV